MANLPGKKTQQKDKGNLLWTGRNQILMGEKVSGWQICA